MSDAAARLNAALEGGYTIERELWRLDREAPLYGMLTTAAVSSSPIRVRTRRVAAGPSGEGRAGGCLRDPTKMAIPAIDVPARPRPCEQAAETLLQRHTR